MGRIWRLAVFLFVVGFVLNLVGIVSHVVVSSFARRWFSTPLPGGFTAAWYAYSWREFQLDQVLTVTLVVAASVTALALGLGFLAKLLIKNFAMLFQQMRAHIVPDGGEQRKLQRMSALKQGNAKAIALRGSFFGNPALRRIEYQAPR